MSRFKPASKKQSRLRMALVGPSGSGKTFTALQVASGLGGRVAVIDTERGSASKYSDRFKFDVLEMETFSPRAYVEAIAAAEAEGYEVLVIDSLSHAWTGKDGALEMVDKAAARSRSGNSFAAWREVTPEHHGMVDAILRSRCHIIATMRVKTEWVLEDDGKGKKVPRKVGLAPVQRDGLEYEFDVVADMDSSRLMVSKSRCFSLTGAVVSQPGPELGRTLHAWLSDGAPADPLPPPESPPAAPTTVPVQNFTPPDPRPNLGQTSPPPAASPVTGEPPEFDKLAEAIRTADAKPALNALLKRIAARPATEQQQLRGLFNARSQELANVQAA